ncbi:MAG: response regulator [Bacteroidota bacterium]
MNDPLASRFVLLKRRYFFLLLLGKLFFFPCLLQAQTAVEAVDSLLERSRSLFPLGGEIEARQALARSQEILYDLGTARAHHFLGRLDHEAFADSAAVAHFQKAIRLYQSSDTKAEELQCRLDLTVTYQSFNYYKQTLDQTDTVIAMAGTLRDSSAIGQALLQKAIVNYKLNQREDSYQLTQQARAFATANSTDRLTVNTLVHLSKLQTSSDSLYLYLKEAAEVAKGITNPRVRAEAELYVLSYLAYFYQDEEDFAAMQSPVQRALQLAQNLGDREQEAQMSFLSAKIFEHEGNLERAIPAARKHLDYERSIRRWYYVIEASNYLASLYEQSGQYAEALAQTRLAAVYQDSMYQAHRKDDLAELENAFQLELKDQQIQLLDQKRRSRVLLISLVAAFLLAIISFLWYRQRARNRTQEQEIKYLRVKEKLAQELQKLDEMKSRFFTNVAHELRTPITLILSPLQGLIKKEKQTAKLEQLQLMQRNGQKLREMLEEIMDLSKLEAQKLEATTVPVALYSLVRRVFSTFESYANYQQIILELDYQAAADLRIQTDPPKLEKILNNLLSNGIKYTPQRGQVSLRVRDLATALEFRVQDSGRGIHAEDLPKIFDRFFQATQSGPNVEGGTGIGLALSQEYARLLEGEIRVESTLGEGSTFVFRCHKREIFAAEEQLLPQPEERPAVLYKAPSRPGQHTVLVVEDNVDMQSHLARLLAPRFRVVVAFNGQEALQKLDQEQQIDAVLSDVMMPQMDGFALLKRLKESERWRQIPVVMLTARTQQQDRLTALRIGVDDYLAKPFDSEELLARLQNILNNYEHRRVWLQSSTPATDGPTANSPVAADNWLTQVEETAREALGKPTFNITFLAQELATSERQFYRRMKAATGLTPNEYLREIRLQRARELVESGELTSLKAVSEAVGFSTPTYFLKLYQERFAVDLQRMF